MGAPPPVAVPGGPSASSKRSSVDLDMDELTPSSGKPEAGGNDIITALRHMASSMHLKPQVAGGSSSSSAGATSRKQSRRMLRQAIAAKSRRMLLSRGGVDVDRPSRAKRSRTGHLQSKDTKSGVRRRVAHEAPVAPEEKKQITQKSGMLIEQTLAAMEHAQNTGANFQTLLSKHGAHSFTRSIQSIAGGSVAPPLQFPGATIGAGGAIPMQVMDDTGPIPMHLKRRSKHQGDPTAGGRLPPLGAEAPESGGAAFYEQEGGDGSMIDHGVDSEGHDTVHGGSDLQRSAIEQVRHSRRMSAPTLPRLPVGASVVSMPIATPTGSPSERGYLRSPTGAGSNARREFSFGTTGTPRRADGGHSTGGIASTQSARATLVPSRSFVHVTPAMRQLGSSHDLHRGSHPQAIVMLAPLSEAGPSEYSVPHGGVRLHPLLSAEEDGVKAGHPHQGRRRARVDEVARRVRKRRSLSMSAAASRALASSLPSMGTLMPKQRAESAEDAASGAGPRAEIQVAGRSSDADAVARVMQEAVSDVR